MRVLATAMGVATLLTSATAAAQVAAPTTRAGCVNLASDGAVTIRATGTLSLQTFAGAPNFESVADGDTPERYYVLTLPRATCVDDGGAFADPRQRFTAIQIDTGEHPETRDALRVSLGRRVTITGEGMAANTGHHHTPLLLIASSVTRR